MKKRMAGVLCVFLALMMTFTILSRAADSVNVAQISVKKPEKGKISHTVSGTGKVVQNREQAVSTQAGQIVKTIYVEEGQQVEKGELLFELEPDSLKEQILEKKRELAIDDLESKDKATAKDAQEIKKEITRGRAAEDYQVAAGKGNTAISRAAKALQDAKKKLKAFNKAAQSGSGTGEDEVEAVLSQTCEEKQEALKKAIADKEELEKKIDELVKQALEDAREGRLNIYAGSRSMNYSPALEQETEELSEEEEATLTAAEHELHYMAAEGEIGEQTALPEEAPLQAETEGPENIPEVSSAEPDITPEESLQESQEQISAADNTPQETESSAPAENDTEQNTDFTDSPSESAPKQDGSQVWGNDTEAETTQMTETEKPAPTQAELDLLERRIRRQNQSLLDEAQQWIEECEKEKEAADKALQDYQSSKAEQGEANIASTREQLKAQVEACQQAYNDAVTAAGDSLRSAGRVVEDASLPEGTDSTAQIDALNRETKELQLEKLEKLLEDDGKIISPISGVVTKINITTGDRTPDGTAILLADTSTGCRLVVQVDAQNEKYVARNDAVVLRASNSKKDIEGMTVDSVTTNDADSSLLDISVKLPADLLEMGTLAELKCEKTSEIYDQTIPVQALRSENGQYYVLVTRENQSVMGTELVLQRVDVTVLDKNDTTAALAPGALSGQQAVVTDADKYVDAGSRVRLRES